MWVCVCGFRVYLVLLFCWLRFVFDFWVLVWLFGVLLLCCFSFLVCVGYLICFGVLRLYLCLIIVWLFVMLFVCFGYCVFDYFVWYWCWLVGCYTCGVILFWILCSWFDCGFMLLFVCLEFVLWLLFAVWVSCVVNVRLFISVCYFDLVVVYSGW